jgi:hypothetical protein
VLDRNVEHLSGGELQRFAIAVVAAQKADVYMIDEPSSYLDVRQRLHAAKVSPAERHQHIGNQGSRAGAGSCTFMVQTLTVCITAAFVVLVQSYSSALCGIILNVQALLPASCCFPLYYIIDTGSYLFLMCACSALVRWLRQVIRELLGTEGEGHQQRYVIVVEHDLSVLDYLSDFICCLYGKPGAYGVVTLPFSVREGINIFLAGGRWRWWGAGDGWSRGQGPGAVAAVCMGCCAWSAGPSCMYADV